LLNCRSSSVSALNQDDGATFMSGATQKTAFVFAGGGSLGAVQVGMLRELVRHGLDADFGCRLFRGGA
jgi:predicted acylesterase/phospholipase RssA